MVDYDKLRKKFPGKGPKKIKKSAAVKAIAREYELKKAEIVAHSPLKRGFPYYMTIILGLIIVGSIVGTEISKRGGIDLSPQKNRKMAVDSVKSLAIALGRYCYHVGSYPSTEDGLAQLAAKNVPLRGWNGPYIKKVKQDPWKRDYVYVNNGRGKQPTLYSKGPDGIAGTTDDIIADVADFDAAFRDTSWTKGWMPKHLRDIVVAETEAQKRALQEEVEHILHPDVPVEGVTPLADGWEFAAADRDDAPRRTVRVPHDWRASGTADEAKAGAGVYRRKVLILSKAEGRYVALRFSRISGGYSVAVNGETVGEGVNRDCVELDITKAVKYGASNEIAVKVVATDDLAQVYTGAGLVGEASLAIEDATDRILEGSLKVTTLEADGEGAKMRLEYATPVGPAVNEFEVAEPRLWSPSRPFLYKGYLGGRLYQYAIRKVEFTDESFDECQLDGKPLKLKGVRLTADLGPLGAAFNREAARRKLQAVKDAGANAVQFIGRPDRGFLELCDEMGLLVVDRRAEAFAEGLCDATGLATPRHDIWRAFWNENEMTARIVDDWNRDVSEGETVVVRCATSCDEAELFVNGESAGRRKKAAGATTPEEALLSWRVKYDPGELKAIVYENGQYAGETVRRTAFAPQTVKLTPNKRALAEGEIVFVTVETADEYGTVLPHASCEVSFELEGPGEIVAAASASPDECGPYGPRTSVRLYEGRAVAVVRRNDGGSGLPLKFSAGARGLRTDFVVLPRR